MEFTGDLDDVCPISYTPVRSLEHPVGFDAGHAYDCDSAVTWITKHRPCDPMTSMPLVGIRVEDVLHPLIIQGEAAHLDATRARLQQAGALMLDKPTRIRRAAPALYVNMLLLLLSAVTMQPHPGVLIAATALSFVHLAFQTCQTYIVDGKMLVCSFVSLLIDVICIVSTVPKTSFALRFMFAQAAVLSVRLLIDTRQLMMATTT